MWKPSGVMADGPHPTFAQAVLCSPAPEAVATLIAEGKASMTVSEGELFDLLRAAFDRNDPTVPETLSDGAHRDVPDFVESVVGCRLSPSVVNVIVRCRKILSVYVTVGIRPACLPDGDTTFTVTSVYVGMLPVPQSVLRRLAGSNVLVIPAQRRAYVAVTEIDCRDGTLTIDLEATERGSQWLKSFLNL